MHSTLYSAFAAAACILHSAYALKNDQSCKCLPADDCWPSRDSWNQLNATVNGRLIRGTPPASVCYPEQADYDAEACQEVIRQWTSSAWHGADPVSVTAPPSDGCFPIYPNGTSISGDPLAGQRGCSSETYPVYVVNASSTGDVQAGVKFARQHAVRLNVKSTGHGRSSIPGSLSIWTHHFRGMEFHQNYAPQGYNATSNGTQMAITFGAGVMDRQAFEFAADHDAVVVGGTDSTVGLVGWAGAGAHGYLTGVYGMGADNFLEATVVLPNGDIVVANEHLNADVFWAVRGGGAGTWGVITSLTMKAYPMPSTVFWSLTLSGGNGTMAAEWYQNVAHVIADYPRLKENGLSGYITLSGPPMVMTNAILAYDQSAEAIEEVAKPLTSWLKSQNSSVEVTSEIVPLGTWIDFYHMFNLTESVGGNSQEVSASRLLPARSFQDVDALAECLSNIGPGTKESQNAWRSGRSISGTVTGSMVPVDNALNPAWRDTIVHLIVNEAYPVNTPADIAANITEDMSQTAYKLRELAPDSGAYINERGSFVPDWQKTLYGDNYSRLLSIKHEVDPDSVQWCELCVASDEWYERDDGRFCKREWA